MRTIRNLVTSLAKDESAATLIEYSLLIGLITVAVILTVIAVGGWVSNTWTNLNTNLRTTG